MGLSSGFEDGEHLTLSDDVVEADENRFEFPRCRGGNRGLHLHRFDEYDVVPIADASPDPYRKRADTPGDLGHNLDVWHSVLRGQPPRVWRSTYAQIPTCAQMEGRGALGLWPQIA